MPLPEKNYKSFDKRPVILIAPLDWGLGHATRCIPLIRHLLNIGCEVIVATDGEQKALLEHEFTNIRFEPLRGYRLKYGKNRWQTILNIFIQIPKILIAIKRETAWISGFLKKNKVHAIISDNRYGLFSHEIPSVFITHQLLIKTPFGKRLDNTLRRMNYRLIEKFSECWIPDYPGTVNLSGELSHPAIMPSIPVKYIGALSRINKGADSIGQIELLIILSGPEPQRSIFEKILLNELCSFNGPAMMVRGLPLEKKSVPSANKNLAIHNYLSSDKLNKAITSSEIIISRSGYSTVMDLIGLNKKCVFIPTPGQSEQEYLARYLYEKKLCLFYLQEDFSLADALEQVRKQVVLPFNGSVPGLYKQVLHQFMQSIAPE